MRPSFLPPLAAAAALALALASPAAAQGSNPCPDGFSGACCASANPNLPAFPAYTWGDARQTCWIDCGPFPNVFDVLNISPPTPTGACGEYSATLSGPLVNGSLHLYYTRQWQQNFPMIGQRLVYRFVAIGDVQIFPQGGWSCAVEMINPAGTGAFVFGFVDYAFKASGPPPCPLQFDAAALALGHPCDMFSHDPGCPFSGNPLPPTHPLDQYTLVAPGSNFTPNPNLVPPQGPMSNAPREGIRDLQVNSAGTCSVTERFASLQVNNVLRQCACVSPTLTGQGPFWRQDLTAATQCSSTLDTAPLCPFNFSPPPMATPFPTLIAWSVGSWTPGQFPGMPGGNHVFLAQGAGTLFRPGNSNCPPQNPARSVYYGVENRWGVGGAVTRRVDLADNVRPPQPGTVGAFPLVGAPGSATHVVFFY